MLESPGMQACNRIEDLLEAGRLALETASADTSWPAFVALELDGMNRLKVRSSQPPLRQMQGLAAPEQRDVEECREGMRVEASAGSLH